MMLSDLRFALRLLRRNPGFTIVSVLTIALGLGVNVAIFSLADGMLFRPLPYRDPDRLVLIQGFDPKSSQAYSRVLRVDFEQIRDHHPGIDDIAVAANRPRFTWTGTAGTEAISATEATPNLLSLLGVGAHVGRPLQPGDETIRPVPAMLRYQSWQRRFGGDPSVIGRTLTFDQGSVQIVGVLPEHFIYPLQGSLVSGELLLVSALDPAGAANPRSGTRYTTPAASKQLARARRPRGCTRGPAAHAAAPC